MMSLLAAPPASRVSFPRAAPRAPAARARVATPARAMAGEGEPASGVCPTCGVKLSEAIQGCDGSGRIAGGVGAVLKWWPIKAFRPCPDLVASGMQYTRRGQSLDEVAFGRKAAGDDMSLEDRLKGK